MSNTTTTANDCTRCGGEGLSHYQHVAGGKCFLCGKTLRGSSVAAARPEWTRHSIISKLSARLSNARLMLAEGWSLEAILADYENAENGITHTQRLAIAPADVRARAEAAFAKLAA